MKASTSVLAATLLLAGSVALATTHDDSKTYSATIDPPAGTNALRLHRLGHD